MDEILKVTGVSKQIKKKKIIDKFSFSMSEGEIVGLLGPNGAGKTTLMRMIVGLISIDEGEIIIDGYSVKDDFVNAIKNVGAVIETPELYPYLSGYENLKLLSRINGKQYIKKIDEIIELVQLKKSIHNKVKTYSLGMRQRLGVAQALVHNPKLIILDEPMNGLDPVGVKQLREYLKSVAKEKRVAILVSSHILSEIELLSDRVIVIADGKEISGAIKPSDKNRSIYCIKVNSLNDIDNILQKEIINRNFDECSFEVELSDEEVPQCIRRIVENNIDIYFCERKKEKLEEQFLNMLQGGEENDKNFVK